MELKYRHFEDTNVPVFSLHIGQIVLRHIHLLHLDPLPVLLLHVAEPLDLLDLGVNGADGLLEGADSKVTPGLVGLDICRLPRLR